MTTPRHEDYVTYPESTLRDRTRLAYEWIPANANRLLDGGCAFGYGTVHFKGKAREVWGVDPNADFVDIAQRRYPTLHFRQCGLESTPFEREFFDVIVLNDVLEHVVSEQAALNEMFRILAPGGTFIITTPHKGLFSFMDPDNYVYHLRTKAPGLYRALYRAKYKQPPPTNLKPGYEQLHRHYNRADFTRLLDNSDFRGRYQIERTFRGGLLAGVLAGNVFEFLSLFLGAGPAAKAVKPLLWLADFDYFIPYGPLAYNIGLKIKKL